MDYSFVFEWILDWFNDEKPDILCMQEVRMSQEQIAEKKNIKTHSPPEGYVSVQADAEKKAIQESRYGAIKKS